MEVKKTVSDDADPPVKLTLPVTNTFGCAAGVSNRMSPDVFITVPTVPESDPDKVPPSIFTVALPKSAVTTAVAPGSKLMLPLKAGLSPLYVTVSLADTSGLSVMVPVPVIVPSASRTTRHHFQWTVYWRPRPESSWDRS